MIYEIKNKALQNSHQISVLFKDDINDDRIQEVCGIKKLEGFECEAGEINAFVNEDGYKNIIVGLGLKNKNPNIETIVRKAIFHNLKINGNLQISLDEIDSTYHLQVLMGSVLANYKLNKSAKDTTNLKKIIFISSNKSSKELLQKATILAESMSNVMDLVNAPSNIKTPYYLADFATKLGKSSGFTTKAIKGDQVEKEGLHALYAVGKASEAKPAFIVMEYKPKSPKKNLQKIGLVGKGITFDTGGISIKPSANMHMMKCDMAGGAAVIGMMEVAARMQLPYHIVGIVPAAENTLNGNAYRPGDIIKSYSGKTIEVIDTDAEGRLVLADGLAYMTKNYKPDILIDLATLTGSCVATLGYFAAGLFTTNDALADKFSKAGFECNEKVWRLPMWEDYKPYMNSDMADIKNLSSVPVAGATTAAKFLEVFTNDHPSYVHLDIAGVCYTDNDFYKSRVANAYGVKLLTQFIESL